MRRALEHLLFWTTFILFKVVLNLLDQSPATPKLGTEGLLEKALIILYAQLPYFLIYIPVTYVIFYFIDRYFAQKTTLWVAVFWSIAIFILSLPITDIVNHKFILPYVYHTNDFPLDFDIGSLTYYSFSIGSVVGIACAIKLSRKQVQSVVNEQKLQKEKIEAELKFLKAQVSPHFLFNTLNNIYSLARKQSGETAEAVMKLSQLLRFMINEASNKYITVREEIKVIEDYIALEKLRYTDRLAVTFEKLIDDPGQKIAPLLLIHFVENAFKHGAAESRFKIEIDIRIELKKGQLTAAIRNSKGEANSNHKKTEIGLRNTKRQLELLYPDHSLAILDSEREFKVLLDMRLGHD